MKVLPLESLVSLMVSRFHYSESSSKYLAFFQKLARDELQIILPPEGYQKPPTSPLATLSGDESDDEMPDLTTTHPPPEHLNLDDIIDEELGKTNETTTVTE